MDRILYVTYDGLTDPLGQAQVIPYINGLAAKGYDFTVLSYEKSDRFKKFNSDIKGLLNKEKISWKPFRYHKKFSLIATSYDILHGFIYLLFAIPRQKIKIVHCRSYIPAILGLLFKKIYGTKFIFDMRGFWADERIEGNIFKKGMVYKFFKRLEKLFLLNADATISLTRNAIIEMGTWPYMTDSSRSKMHHITTCCDIVSYSREIGNRVAGDKTDSLTFLYVGSIGPWQSFEQIMSFINFVYHYLPHSHFKMLINWGSQTLEEHLEKGGYDRSRFTIESLTNKEIPGAIKNADVGFFFYPPDYAKKACSPTKMGEMLAAGIPIITGHSVGDIEELVDTNDIGFVLREFSDKEFKSGIDHITSLIRKEKDKLSYKCLAVAEDYFSLQKGIDKYAGIYQSMLAGKK